MPDCPDFEQIARTLAEGMGAPAGSIDPIVAQLRHTARAVVIALSPWTRHHPTCARVTDADACDCGLNAALKQYGAPDA
jgi:hypothetical protein